MRIAYLFLYEKNKKTFEKIFDRELSVNFIFFNMHDLFRVTDLPLISVASDEMRFEIIPKTVIHIL